MAPVQMGNRKSLMDSFDVEKDGPGAGYDADFLDTVKPPLQKSGSLEEFAWEQSLLEETLLKNSPISKAAVVGFSDGVLKAWSPVEFTPDSQAITDILDAFNGNIDGLAERGLNVGCGANVAVPGKIYEDRGIYGNDGHGGGTSAFTSQESVIIIVFDKDPSTANRLGQRTANFMRQHKR